MEIAVITAILCGVVSTSTFCFQRFTLGIARGIVFGAGGSSDRSAVASYQKCMTPRWMHILEYLSYFLGITAIVLGSDSFGWAWGIGIIAWLFFGRGLVSPIWPFPSRTQCVAIADQEARRGLVDVAPREGQAARQACRAVVDALAELRARGPASR